MIRLRSGVDLGTLGNLLEAGSLTGLTDGELLGRFAAGRGPEGEAAFRILVGRHGPMVLTVCRQRLGDRHAADDAFQAVFLVLARRAGSIRRPDLLGPWLHGVAWRIARRARARVERRRRREGSEVEMDSIESAEARPDPRPIRAEEAAAVHEEVGRLPERYRRAVVLCHFEGLTHADAARRLGCAPGTVGSLVSRARDLLRTRLARRGLSAGALAMAGALEAKAAAVPTALERATVRAALAYATRWSDVTGLVSSTAAELAGGTLRTMAHGRAALGGVLLAALGATVVAAGELAAGSARPDEPRPARAPIGDQVREQPAGAPSPSLPDAVTKPPDWLGKDAPFDVAVFFAAPPPDENAARRYLDALFEFGSEMAVCFPEGPDRESRKRAAERRSSRFAPVFQAARKDLRSIPGATIDAAVSEYDTGFRKLDWAQQRPRCVFETGVGITSRIPHVMVASQVGRVTRLRVHRELERGEIEAALRDLARLLRLSRDLRPRGAMIAELVSASIDRAAVVDVAMPIIATPGLSAGHCERILALLAEHETRSIDAYSEGLRAEYLLNRVTLHDLVFDQARLREEWGTFGNPAGPSIVAEVAEPVLISAAGPGGPLPRPETGAGLKALAARLMSLKNIPNLDARIAQTIPEELSRQVEKLNELYLGWLSVSGAPYLERIRKSSERPRSLDAADLHTRVTRGLLPPSTAFVQSLARSKAVCSAAEGLVLVRRWQLLHGGDVPPSLEAAAKEAGRPSVPTDPYDGRPIRFAVVNGQPTVYAIGQDGRDDGGRVDNTRSPDSGDVVLRLPRP